MISDNRFSVLAIPDSLTFYLNDEDGCKQELKIYNVHDFTINFKVLCTSVDSYNVEPPHGTIRSNCMINITIQLKNHDFDRKKDVFKIDAYSKENEKIVGEKEITVIIEPEKKLDNDNRESTRSGLKAAKSDSNNSKQNKRKESTTLTLENPKNLVILNTGKFVFYIILTFLVGMITGMILVNPIPQDMKLD